MKKKGNKLRYFFPEYPTINIDVASDCTESDGEITATANGKVGHSDTERGVREVQTPRTQPLVTSEAS